jgi:mRNA-degrading endonuclease RelE of RelBE toxin-antitoxin system
MPIYKILFRGKASRQIQQLPPDYFRLVQRHIETLTQTPRPPGVKRLQGSLGFSLRVGVYRICTRWMTRRAKLSFTG